MFKEMNLDVVKSNEVKSNVGKFMVKVFNVVMFIVTLYLLFIVSMTFIPFMLDIISSATLIGEESSILDILTLILSGILVVGWIFAFDIFAVRKMYKFWFRRGTRKTKTVLVTDYIAKKSKLVTESNDLDGKVCDIDISE